MPLALRPARTLRLLYDDPRGRLDYGGRNLYQVSFADATTDAEHMTVAIHTDLKRAVRGAVDTLLPAGRKGGRGALFDRLPGGEKDRVYLDLLRLFPALGYRSFSTAASELERSLGGHTRRLLQNAMEHEGEFPRITFLLRLSWIGHYLPALVREVFEDKRMMPEDPAGVVIRQGVAQLMAYGLKSAFRDTELAVALRARVGDDPAPMLSDTAGLFVLTDLEPTSWAFGHVLSAPNVYRQTPDSFRLLSSTLRDAAEDGTFIGEGRFEEWLAEPENAETIVGNGAAVADLAERLLEKKSDMSAAVVLAKSVDEVRSFLKTAIAGAAFPANACALYSDPDAIEQMMVSKVERASSVIKVRSELRDYWEPFARLVNEASEAVAHADHADVMEEAVASMLPSVFRLSAERSLYAQVQRTRRGLELLMPGTVTPADLADGVRNRTLYLFAAEGAIFPLTALPPPFLFAGDLRDFTPLTERLGSASTGSYLATFFNDLHDVVVAEKAQVINFAGDAMYGVADGRGAGARAVAILCRMEELLRAFRDQAKTQGDPLVEMGMAMEAGPYFSFTVGPWKPTVSAHLNTVSRLMGSAREVALFLERYANEPVESDVEEFLEALYAEKKPHKMLALLKPSPYPELSDRIESEIGDPVEYVLRDDLFGMRDLREFVTRFFVRKKPDIYLPRVYVRDGSLHNKGIVVTAEVLRRLKSELKMVSQDVFYSDAENRLINHYFDPVDRKNRPASPLSDRREVAWFLDAKTRTYRIFASLPPVQLKGMAEPVELYELLPANTFLAKRILPAAT